MNTVLDKTKQDVIKLEIVKHIQAMDVPVYGNIKITIRDGHVTNYSVEKTVKLD